jgi:hypothetical protein
LVQESGVAGTILRYLRASKKSEHPKSVLDLNVDEISITGIYHGITRRDRSGGTDDISSAVDLNHYRERWGHWVDGNEDIEQEAILRLRNSGRGGASEVSCDSLVARRAFLGGIDDLTGVIGALFDWNGFSPSQVTHRRNGIAQAAVVIDTDSGVLEAGILGVPTCQLANRNKYPRLTVGAPPPAMAPGIAITRKTTRNRAFIAAKETLCEVLDDLAKSQNILEHVA